MTTSPTLTQVAHYVWALDDIAEFFDGELDNANVQRPSDLRPFKDWGDVYRYALIAPESSGFSMLKELIPNTLRTT